MDDKAIFWLNQKAAKATFFFLFSGLEKEFWGQLMLKGKLQPHFIVEIVFILGKNV